MTKSERPYWFPVLCDDAHLAGLREDYPDKSDWSDEDLLDYFDEGAKYSTTWDHTGDAYSDYEPLADAFLALLDSHERLLKSTGNMAAWCAATGPAKIDIEAHEARVEAEKLRKKILSS